MSGQLGELVVSISADIARFRSDMGRMVDIADQNSRRMTTSLDAVGRTMSALGAGVSVAGLVAMGRELTQAALAAEKLQMQFKASTGSATVAAREFSYVQHMAQKMGLDFQTTATSYAKFMAATRETSIEGQAARRVFEGVSKAVSAMGLSADESNGIFTALQQMMSKGKVSAEELTGQLGERLPGAARLAASAMGLTTAELLKQMQEGKIMAADFLPKLAKELEKTYGTAADEAAKKGQASINRFNNEVRETAKTLGEKLMPALKAASDLGANWLKSGREILKGDPRYLSYFMSGDLPTNAGNYDPQMARIEADARAAQDAVNATRAAKEKLAAQQAEMEKAAQAAAEAAQQEYNTYTSALDALNKQISASSPNLTAYEKALIAVDEQVTRAVENTPQYEKSLKGAGERIKEQITLAHNLAVELASVREETRRLEEMSTSYAEASNFGAMAGGLEISPLAYSDNYKQRFSLMGGGEAGKQKFSLTGAGQKGWSQEVVETQRQKDSLLEIEKKYNKELISMKLNAAEQAIDIARNMATESKGIAIAAIIAQRALSITQIMMNTEVSASSALLPPPVGLGPIAGQALAAQIRSMGYASAALSFVGGIGEIANTLDGKRESGGPVRAGRTYLVGERGPELMTVGADGYVTPNSALGGSITIHQTFNAPGADEGVLQRMKAMANQAKEAAKAEILASMNRGGEFALASGRMRR